ncbi:MAG TPA: hypothetical protein PKG71_02325 [Candidatus Woesebacteria bacterium]|nr:hypothetical protein [Candidatus Woesebacteria bacterium]HNS94781.1 hypothetical protein [Candidatus Woesebacteria bacterium]
MPLQLVWIGVKRYFATFRKVFFVVMTFLVVLYVFAAFSSMDNARNSAGKPTPAQIEEARRLRLYDAYSSAHDPVNDEDAVLGRELMRGFMCSTIGELCTDNPEEAYLYKDQSFTFKASGLLSETLRHPPSSFYYWARGTLENAGFVPQTYAQGIGFAALTSFQPIWKVFRNIAYLVIVIVIMIVGFMVMFKVGGGGKNAVTLESALPKLVIALLAISMSYALAGLFIDIMYISVALIINLMGPVSGMNAATQTKMIGGVITGGSQDLFFMLMGNIGQSDGNYYNLAGSLYSLVPTYMQRVIDGLLNSFVIGVIGHWRATSNFNANPVYPGATATPGNNVRDSLTYIGRALTNVVRRISPIDDLLTSLSSRGHGALPISTIANIAQIILGMIVGSLLGSVLVRTALMFLLILGMVVIYFRLFFTLLVNYVEIIISILVAPLALMLEAIPGQNAFMNWMKSLFVNLSVYPIVLVVVLIARAIMNVSAATVPMWSPPFIVNITDQTSLQTLVGAVLIYSLPNIIKGYKQKLKPASLTESMGIGVGSLFVGAAPILRGGSTIMGASGLTGAMATRISAPLGKIMGKTFNETTGKWQNK